MLLQSNPTFTIYKPATRSAWLESRHSGIGSSEAAVVLGLSSFETPYQLWTRKRQAEEQERPSTPAMYAGHLLEGAVATYFADTTGAIIDPESAGDWIAYDPTTPFLRVSPDRLYTLPESDEVRILECKTTQHDIDPDNLPPYWYVQLIYQMGVTGVRRGALAWLTRGVKFGFAEVEFNELAYDTIRDAVAYFWTLNVVKGQEPRVTNLADVLAKFPTSVTGKTIYADEELQAAVQLIKSLKPQIDNLTEQKREAEDFIKEHMEDAEVLALPASESGKPLQLCTWKTSKDSQRFNERRFKEEHPDLWAEYAEVVKGSRRFLVK